MVSKLKVEIDRRAGSKEQQLAEADKCNIKME